MEATLLRDTYITHAELFVAIKSLLVTMEACR